EAPRIGHLPRAGEVGNPPAAGVGPRQARVEEVGEPRAVGVGLEAGVEALGVAVQRDHQGPGRGRRLAAAAGEAAEHRQSEAKTPSRFDSARNALVACAELAVACTAAAEGPVEANAR